MVEKSRRGGRELVRLGTAVGEAQTYRFWTGGGRNDIDIGTAFDPDTDTGQSVKYQTACWKVLI